MTIADDIFRAVSEIVGTDVETTFTRAQVRSRLGIAERDWNSSYDPIFQAMGAIVSWDIRSSRDMVELGGVWSLLSTNPFVVLDQTGHMPYTESSRHLGSALPAHDRLRSLYLRDEKHYPTLNRRPARVEILICPGVATPS